MGGVIQASDHHVMFRFTAEPVPGYRLRVEGHTSGLWTMLATGKGTPSIEYSNTYDSIEAALRDAEAFAHYTFGLWGVPLPGSVEWYAASDGRPHAPGSAVLK